MKHPKILSELILNTEYDLAKYKFVLEKFPDAKVFDASTRNVEMVGFKSKLVNQIYSKIEFRNCSNYELHILPYCELEFKYGNKSEIIQVRSMPKQIRLAYRKSVKEKLSPEESKNNVQKLLIGLQKDYKYVDYIKFSKFQLSVKKNEFNEQFLNECRVKILEFIQQNPNCKLDTKCLEPRLKKLLLFT